MNVEHKSREDNFRKLKELERRMFKPNPDFRTLGDELSGHDAAMITVGVKVATTPKPVPGRDRSN